MVVGVGFRATVAEGEGFGVAVGISSRSGVKVKVAGADVAEGAFSEFTVEVVDIEVG